MRERHGRHIGIRLVAGVLLSGVTAAAWLVAPSAPTQAAARPNIVLITTDDMAATDLAWMPKTLSLLRDRGVEVEDFLSNHPLCCPARAQIFTGQYGQNNGVHTNGGRYGGYRSLIDKNNHVGAWLATSGYRTAFVGKHLNGWADTAHRQRGWTIFDPYYRGVLRPRDITTFNNGRPKRYARIHTSDLTGRLSVRYIERLSATGRPFFLWASYTAPHKMVVDGVEGFPVPARRHRSLYPDVVAPSIAKPSFNEPDVSDKPGYVRAENQVSTRWANRHHRARIRTLRSVDDQVSATLSALRREGELANTYVFFTSDNGYLLGEHRLRTKNFPYEESLQVPLLVRGPGLGAGVSRPDTFGLVDLAPTFVDLAGATSRRRLDGRSMMDTLRAGAPGREDILIQAGRGRKAPWWWRGVRSDRYTYVATGGFRELYDRVEDPWQLQNVADDPAYAEILSQHQARLQQLKDCSGASCLTTP